ncbi:MULTISPECIES: enoyl-CoA hydratase/isomerase family protein [unclassified Bacillus (in: firmicutes)]|uniref:enoyl-CoA hydratase/isomerase family protein n=1 Tax=unclassified Bacillus (in: firmicutes) TaxID=185979 RepID=UPI0008E28AD7|nr:MULTISPECIES: enoyl-CoA hydratase/isomerase family protein [unclassified Bacillus (in: firmicutes)]SFA75707.1 Enoyl-CoA hydratase/carnithine racemase [Bacillus sp. UNCCL13]SFQ65775.1 Enoyl-CoA hydratase/carnithine racemase [Bacillus sp. cl95]
MAYRIEENTAGYLVFVIDRQEKRNAINYEIMKGLSEVIELAKSSNVKALVITASGDRAFCSGGDLSVFHQLETEQEAYVMLKKMSDILYELLTLPIPTIALMNGTAVGGGCEIATACDFRLARTGIKAGFVQGNQAITTGWGGGSILVEKFAYTECFKLLLEAKIVPAHYLREIGFIDELYDGDSTEACERFLENIIHKEIGVLKSYKNMYIRKWEQAGLRRKIDEEVRQCAILWESEAHHKYVLQFLNKKKS